MLNVQVYDGQITENFNIAEFKCHANGEVLINADVIAHIQRLQIFRTWYNRPIIPISGYRTKEYNAKVGGAEHSQHLLGLATDIPYPNEFYSYAREKQEEFLNNIRNFWDEWCKKGGVKGGMGVYNTFFHLDSRKVNASNVLAYWDERSK